VGRTNHSFFRKWNGAIIDTGGFCHPDEFRLMPLALEAIKHFNSHGIPAIVISNQTGIADGRFSEDALMDCTQRIIQEMERGGARIDAFYWASRLE